MFPTIFSEQQLSTLSSGDMPSTQQPVGPQLSWPQAESQLQQKMLHPQPLHTAAVSWWSTDSTNIRRNGARAAVFIIEEFLIVLISGRSTQLFIISHLYHVFRQLTIRGEFTNFTSRSPLLCYINLVSLCYCLKQVK